MYFIIQFIHTCFKEQVINALPSAIHCPNKKYIAECIGMPVLVVNEVYNIIK